LQSNVLKNGFSIRKTVFSPEKRTEKENVTDLKDRSILLEMTEDDFMPEILQVLEKRKSTEISRNY